MLMFLAQLTGTLMVIGGAILFGLCFMLPGLVIWFIARAGMKLVEDKH